jgi:polysaccharide pyruvyl transferase WcaK-like protein
MKITGFITAAPNPIPDADNSGLGATTLSWSVEGATLVEVRVGAPDGPLLSRTGPTGTARTGGWVSDGLVFFLQDVSEGRPLTASHTLATATVNVAPHPRANTRQLLQNLLLDSKREEGQLEPTQRLCASSPYEAQAGPRPAVEIGSHKEHQDEGGQLSLVVLSGITANNLGDDAILVSVVRDLQRLEPSARITVLAEQPELCGAVADQIQVPIERSLQGLVQAALQSPSADESCTAALLRLAQRLRDSREAICSGLDVAGIPADFLPGLRSLMFADGVIDCGGASLSPHWKYYFYEKCLDYLLAATPLFVTGQGIDPFADPDDVQLLCGALSRAAKVTLREGISADYLRSIGCRVPFSTTGDDALTLPQSPAKRTASLLSTAGLVADQRYLAFQYRHYLDYAENNLLPLFAEYVDAATVATGLPVVGVPMHFGGIDERADLKKVAQHLKCGDRFQVVEEHLSPSDAKALFAGAQAAFGISYHSAVFSLSSGTPFLGLHAGTHYAQKMRGLAQLYNIPWLPVPVPGCQPEEFGRQVKKVLGRRERISLDLERRQKELLGLVTGTREAFLRQVGQKSTHAGWVRRGEFPSNSCASAVWNYDSFNKFCYGDDTSYKKGIAFLDGHGDIEDWGCGFAHAKTFVEKSRYIGIDGSAGKFADRIADLRKYTSEADCIFMRHVLEHNYDWRRILANAVASFKRRMVLIIFTPLAETTRQIATSRILTSSPVPDISFRREDLTTFFKQYKYAEESLVTNTQYKTEHIFYIEK